MRSRRRRGRREPLFWSRVCAQTFGNLLGPQDDSFECDISEVQFGVVLFDASAAALGNNESRVTLRALHWPCDVAATANPSSTVVPGSMWCVVVKTSLDLATLTGLTFGDLLGGGATAPFDVLDVRLYSCRGPLPNQFGQIGQRVGSDPTRDYVISAQRKMENEDKIVALYGFWTHFGLNLGSTQSLTASVNVVVSALWQRTLR